MATRKPSKKKPAKAPDIPMNPPPMPIGPASMPPLSLGPPNIQAPPFAPSMPNIAPMSPQFASPSAPMIGAVSLPSHVPSMAPAPTPSPLSPILLNTLANAVKAAALRSDMGNIAANGLPDIHQLPNQERIGAGYAPGPYQYNMPNPNAALADPEASARDRVARRGRSASRTGQFEQRLLNAGMPQTPPEMQRNTRPDLTPADFLAEQLARQTAADQAVADASQAMQEAGGNQAAFDKLTAAQKKAKGVNPTRAQAQTYQQVADSRGMLPGMNGNPTVAENLANRRTEVAARQKAVADRGKVRGKSKELGIPRVAAAALNGSLGNGANAATFGDLFNHYLGLTGNPQTAAALANAHHQAQNADPIRDQLFALAGTAQDPAVAKQALDAGMKRLPGAAAAAPANTSVVSGLDQGRVKTVVEDAINRYKASPRYAADYIAKELQIPLSEADDLIKNSNHPFASKYNRSKADAAKQNAMGDMSIPPIMQGPAGMLLPWFSPSLDQYSRGIAP